MSLSGIQPRPRVSECHVSVQDPAEAPRQAHSEGRADGAESPVALLVRESRSQSPVAFSESLVPAVVHCLTDPNNQLKLRLPAAVRVARLDCAAEPEHKPTGGLDGVSASAPSLPLPSDAPTSFILERALLCDQDITEHAYFRNAGNPHLERVEEPVGFAVGPGPRRCLFCHQRAKAAGCPWRHCPEEAELTSPRCHLKGTHFTITRRGILKLSRQTLKSPSTCLKPRPLRPAEASFRWPS
uniref:uncharacterized protein LOC123462992 n=1 Tax=Jaculus jaculus TaxID=51337 RepID=UPI001E1AFD75|nr:uncharacterized protein LOC123462992 [Jaculus jaculus]XP_045013759.1 uncharacterized protein LOC123462992 [Jaculus jaculus]XP_045013760.1 uncharacterized protein LOC123462992 [Jaculus jaculus]